MKRYLIFVFYIFFAIILCIPLINVDALVCNDKVLIVENKNFMCSGIEGDLTFTYGGQDYSNFFKLRDDGRTIDIDPTISFPVDIEVANIEVKDSSGSTIIKIKNNKYTTTTTTTQAPENIVVVTFDKNDGSDLSQKKCSIINGSDYCSVVLPKLSIDGFNGWGTQSTCKEGISGTVKVYEDVKYYACYKTEEDNNSIGNDLVLKELSIMNTVSGEKINYGVLDNAKDTYDVTVLYEVNSIQINAVPENENVDIKIEGHIFDLSVGVNKVYIKLDNNGNQKVYTLNVLRLEEGMPLKKIHYLSSLVIGGSEINFDKDIFVYNVTIENDIEQLLISKETYFEEDIVTVKGNENLVNGSQVLIEVTGDDGEITVYTINVIKEKKLNLFILLFIMLALLIVVFVIMVYIKRRNNNDKIKEIKKTKEKIKKAKSSVKNQQPEILENKQKDEEIEVLKF